MLLSSLFSVLALASVALSAPVVVQENSLAIRNDAKAEVIEARDALDRIRQLAHLSTRTDNVEVLSKRVDPIQNGAVFGGCQGQYVNIQDLGYVNMGRLVGNGVNVPLAAQAIRDSINNAPDAPNGSRTLTNIANAGLSGQYRVVLTAGESNAIFATPVLVAVINEALEGMRQAQRGTVTLTMRDEQHRVIFRLIIMKVSD